MTTTATYNNVKTNIAWMPELPEHWKLSRVKNYFTFSNEVVGEDYSGFNVLSLSVNGVIIRDMESGKGKHSMSMDLYQIVQPKSIILCLFDMDVTPRIVGICENLGIITSAYTTIVPKENVCERFYYYFFLHQDYNKSLKAQGTGVRTTLTNTQFGAVKIPVPPYQEQIQIANYLDNQSQKINHFIAKKQQFIALLKEQRQSVINEAVTKGGNNWVTKRLKYISDLRFSNVDKHTIEGEEIVRLCNYVDVYKNDFITNDLELMKASATLAEIDKFSVLKNDIIITKDSETPEDIAVPTLVIEDLENVVCGYHLALIRADETQILSEYLFRVFQSKKINSHFRIGATGVTRVGLSLDDITGVSIPFPKSLSEQSQIIKHIKTETTTIDTAIAKTLKEIELIKEYKEAMIAEAVMGKVNYNKK